MRKDGTIRVTLDLSPQFFDRLDQLRILVDAESKVSLIRDALRIYEFIAKKTVVEGCSFTCVSKSGESETIRFII